MKWKIDSKKIKELRKARGWNQSDLSKYSTVDKSVISRIERFGTADYRVSVILNIANSLDVPIGALIETNEKTNELTPELEGAINKLKKYNSNVQNQAAAIIHALLNTTGVDK